VRGGAAIAALLVLTRIAAAQAPADALRTDLTYLASDELEGRATPSRGLDLAADYIAQQFKRTGLQPAAPDGTYFQPATFGELTRNTADLTLTLKSGSRTLSIPSANTRLSTTAPLDFTDEKVTVLPEKGDIPRITGLIVAGLATHYARVEALDRLQAAKPLLILLIGRAGQQTNIGEIGPQLAPVIRIRDDEAMEFLNKYKFEVSLHTIASKPVTLRNVAAVLPGSDPALRTQFLLLTAHYDHLGRTPEGIFHGANDNGSGTVSVIEIARELASLKPRPKRSIMFIAFFGEEEGLLGSDYYVHHPLAPLKDTIADINLEQIGRTDDKTGPRISAFAFTGPSYTNIPEIMAKAAKPEDVKVSNPPDANDFFARSDNYAFARADVVDTTIAVAFEFPGYHALEDTIDKIDFDNMAKVDHAIAAGLARIANDPEPPKWTGKRHP
jgi:hypothetical protein